MEILSADVLVIGGGFSAQMAVITLMRLTQNKQLNIVMATPAMSDRDCLPLNLPDQDISWEKRYQDTIRAGAGQCDHELAGMLCQEGPDMLEELTQAGIDRDCDQQALSAELYNLTYTREKRLTALRLFVRDGRVQGALCADNRHGFAAVSAGTVLLANGGYGEIYRSSPIVGSMGDAIGMVFYAGAAMADLEFVFFPPQTKAESDGWTPITLGGLIVDSQCRTGVSGLYAAGGCTAGIHGAGLIPGNEILSALVFGKLAGQAIAQADRLPGADAGMLNAWAEEILPLGSHDLEEKMKHIRADMESAMRSGAGPVREQSSIEAALQTVSRLQHELNELPPCPEDQWFFRLRLENDLIAARLTLLSSLERRESVGVYRRSDHPEKAESPYRVQLQLNGLLLFPEKEAWHGAASLP